MALPTAAALGAGAAVAAGAISSDGTITACYVTTAGTDANSQDFTPGYLRVVTSASDCKDNEASLSWNQQGPTGPPGQKGDQGIQGPQGKQGSFDLAVLNKNTVGTLRLQKMNVPISALSFLGKQGNFEHVGFGTIDAKVFPTLQKDVAFGTHIKSILLDTRNAKGQAERFSLAYCVLTSFQLGGSGKTPLASVDIECGGIKEHTTGKQKAGPIPSWNVTTAKQTWWA